MHDFFHASVAAAVDSVTKAMEVLLGKEVCYSGFQVSKPLTEHIDDRIICTLTVHIIRIAAADASHVHMVNITFPMEALALRTVEPFWIVGRVPLSMTVDDKKYTARFDEQTRADANIWIRPERDISALWRVGRSHKHHWEAWSWAPRFDDQRLRRETE